MFCRFFICFFIYHDHLLDPKLNNWLQSSDYPLQKLQTQAFHEYSFHWWKLFLILVTQLCCNFVVKYIWNHPLLRLSVTIWTIDLMGACHLSSILLPFVALHAFLGRSQILLTFSWPEMMHSRFGIVPYVKVICRGQKTIK